MKACECNYMLVAVLFVLVLYLWYSKKDECNHMKMTKKEEFDEEDSEGVNIYNNLSSSSSENSYGRKF